MPKAPSLFYLGRQRRLVRAFLSDSQRQAVLNIGAGATQYGDNVIALDARSRPGCDLRADATLLPFGSGTVSRILCESVLEHVREPEQAVAEMHRVMADGGRFLAIVSFMTPFHADPGTREDFQRYTIGGLRRLFGRFDELEIGPAVGPTSAFCLHAQFFLASLASLGSERLFYFWFYVLAWPLWPWTRFDRLLLQRFNADVASADLYCMGRKSD